MKFTHNFFFQFSTEKNRLQLWLEHKSVLGEPVIKVQDIICSCTGLTKAHFKHLMDKDDETYSLDKLRIETRASYHCGGCLNDLKSNWEKEIALKGLISKKIAPVRARLNNKGVRQTYLEEYPVFWIKKLNDLQNEWRAREDFVEEFSFEIVDAPIPYVDFKLTGECESKKASMYFSHFEQFVESKTKAKWYFKLLAI